MTSPVSNYQSSFSLTMGVVGAGDFAGFGEIGLYAFSFLPNGVLSPVGELAPIVLDPALFAVMGTLYGGNGVTNYGLPNLNGVTLIGQGTGFNLPTFSLAQSTGTATDTLTAANLPAQFGGNAAAFGNYQPSLAVNYEICVVGAYPTGSFSVNTLGMVQGFAGNVTRTDYLPCDGRLLSIGLYPALFSLLGTTYGGNGVTNFALPDLRGRTIVGAGGPQNYQIGQQIGSSTVSLTSAQAPTTTPAAQPFDNAEPSLAMTYVVALQGVYPTVTGAVPDPTLPYVGQIVAFAGGGTTAQLLVDSGKWAVCNGQALPIAQYSTLFSLIGTTYGGDGVSTFQLPNLSGDAAIGSGSTGLGQVLGNTSTTLTTGNIPAANLIGESFSPQTTDPLTAGATVTFTLTFDQNIVVPSGIVFDILLNDGGFANYSGPYNAPETALTFTYTVGPQDKSTDLTMTGTAGAFNSLTNLAGSTPLFANLQLLDTGLKIGVIGAESFATTAASTLKIGDTVQFTLTLNESVSVNGLPLLSLNNGAVATYSGPATPTTVLTFSYQVKAGDNTADLQAANLVLPSAVTINNTATGLAVDLTNFSTIDTGLAVACYLRGTRIVTPRGEIAIEELRVGDLAVTASGALRPVTWIGHRQLDAARHPAPREVWPVRVAAGAFGDKVPSRDLWLSPGHNIEAEGRLMPISALVNGVSVKQVERNRVEYWHVELDAHDLILAEGLPAESYLDAGNRAAFANGGAFIEAHPTFAPKHWAETCLPLVFTGPAVARTKARLLARLAARGVACVEDADPHLRVDGRRVEPIPLSPTRLAFVLPEGGREILLCSAAFVPAETTAESADARELGLCVARLTLDGHPVALARAALAGWHEAEYAQGRFAHRWTRGAARLPAARIAVIDLAERGRYWRRGEETPRAARA